MFAGACGHTYGSHSVWQMYSPRYAPTTFACALWDEAIHSSSARQMLHLKNLMLSRPYLTRIPAPDLLPNVTPPPPPADLTNEDDRLHPLRAAHPVATRDSAGRYGLVYFPLAGQRLRVDLRPLAGRVQACWFDPRIGVSYPIGEFASGRGDLHLPARRGGLGAGAGCDGVSARGATVNLPARPAARLSAPACG